MVNEVFEYIFARFDTLSGERSVDKLEGLRQGLQLVADMRRSLGRVSDSEVVRGYDYFLDSYKDTFDKGSPKHSFYELIERTRKDNDRELELEGSAA